MTALHANHLGEPTGCNAYCQPDEHVHAQLVYGAHYYGEPCYPSGFRVVTVWGPAVVVDHQPAPEAPPAVHPAVQGLPASLIILRFDRRPAGT